MTLKQSSAVTRKAQLITVESLERATGNGSAPYAAGERHRNNKMYLVDDTVKDANGNPYTCLEENRNKPPANNPRYWKPDTQPSVIRWSDIAVGTEILTGMEVIHNSANWICAERHVKTAGNGPRQGSTIWTRKE